MKFSQPLLTQNKPTIGTQLYIRGKKATLNEYNVSVALEDYGLEYLFQVWYWGGRTLRGGQILDFLVYPWRIPVQVFGDYWHKQQLSATDRYNLSRLASLFQREVVILWGGETNTVEDAKRAVKRKIL